MLTDSSNIDINFIPKELKTKDKIIFEAIKLFALKGYGSVSIREIAKQIGIRPGSIYGHFSSKEELMEAAIDYIDKQYKRYFERLNEANLNATSFEEILNNMFIELKKVVNIFDYYGNCMVEIEQFRNEKARAVFLNVFVKDSIGFIKNWFDTCINKEYVPLFDSQTAATLIINSVLVGIQLRVHEDMGSEIPYDISEMYTAVHHFILQSANSGIKSTIF